VFCGQIMYTCYEICGGWSLEVVLHNLWREVSTLFCHVLLQKAAEKTSETARSASTLTSTGTDQFQTLDSVSLSCLNSVNSSSRSVLGPASAAASQLPFFAQTAIGTNARAPGLLSSAYSVADSAALAAASQKLSLQSKGKPLTVSLEPRSGSLSSAVLPNIQHQLVASSQNPAFELINSQLRKAADSGLAAVLVAPPGSSGAAGVMKSVAVSVPPRVSYSLSSARIPLPLASSVNAGLSTTNNSSGITHASSVPPFSSASKPVVARLMAQQRLPGVLALSGMPRPSAYV